MPGLLLGARPDAPDQVWEQAWSVNVMGHVRARGSCCRGGWSAAAGAFVVTVSAAGLLTMLGTATYSVTKHAAVAFAEWLAPLTGTAAWWCTASARRGCGRGCWPSRAGPGKALLQDAAIEPEQVAEACRGLAAGTFLVLPHPEVHGYYQYARAAQPGQVASRHGPDAAADRGAPMRAWQVASSANRETY